MGREILEQIGGNFYAEPAPQVAVRPPSIRQHLAKVLSRSGGCTGGSESEDFQHASDAGNDGEHVDLDRRPR